MFDNLSNGVGIAIVIQDHELYALASHCFVKFVRAVDPMAVRRVPRIPKRTVDELDIILIFRKDSDRYALSLVQFSFLEFGTGPDLFGIL